MINTNLIYIFELLVGIIIILFIAYLKRSKHQSTLLYRGIVLGLCFMVAGLNLCFAIVQISLYFK